MCQKEVVYECLDGPVICKYNHDPEKIEEIRNKALKDRETQILRYKRDQYKFNTWKQY